MACECLLIGMRDAHRGVAALSALGGLAAALAGANGVVAAAARAPSHWPAALSLAWFALLLCVLGATLLVLGLGTAIGTRRTFAGACAHLVSPGWCWARAGRGCACWVRRHVHSRRQLHERQHVVLRQCREVHPGLLNSTRLQLLPAH